MKTNLEKVYMALKEGYRTSTTISLVTGLPMSHCSSYLNELKGIGVAEIAHRYSIAVFSSPRRSHVWRLRKDKGIKNTFIQRDQNDQSKNH